MLSKEDNYISNSEFVFTFTGSDINNMTYEGDTFILPNISIPTAELSASDLDIEIPGEKLKYSPLTIVFKVSEDMTNYINIHDWMKRIVSNDSFSNEKIDGEIIIKNKVNKPIAICKVHDMFPITLSPITLSYVDQVLVIEAEVELEVEWFSISSV